MRPPWSAIVLCGIDAALLASALYGGINFIMDPTGKSMGIDFALPYIPYVEDFLIFGVWLVMVFSVFPAVLIYGLLTEKKWSLFGTMILGALEIVWIATQVVLFYSATGFTFLWALIGGFGVASLILAPLPSMRNFYLAQRPTSRKKTA